MNFEIRWKAGADSARLAVDSGYVDPSLTFRFILLLPMVMLRSAFDPRDHKDMEQFARPSRRFG